jgi:phosphoribosylformimino-5-aminoimidazole carboxamide ribotide isomerase
VDIVPVIDVMAGVVVQARGGNRAHYAPIDSPLCGSSAPAVVARLLSEYCAAHRLYLADLDALQGRPAQVDLVRSLLDDAPERTLWVDAGFTDASAVQAWQAALGPLAARVRPVFASEALPDRAAVRACTAAHPDGLLSLDRRGDERWDRAGCWDDPSLWPASVIVMTLERVGADRGPDLDTLAALRRRSPATRLVGAGGLRDDTDRARAAAAGADAWLVASALHQRRLAPAR